jgi:hypothetical protein
MKNSSERPNQKRRHHLHMRAWLSAVPSQDFSW